STRQSRRQAASCRLWIATFEQRNLARFSNSQWLRALSNDESCAFMFTWIDYVFLLAIHFTRLLHTKALWAAKLECDSETSSTTEASHYENDPCLVLSPPRLRQTAGGRQNHSQPDD